MQKFANRRQAGEMLSELLLHYANKADTVVLGLPRGGVPVAAEIAKALALPLDILVVRKLGVPDQEELALGAIARDNTVVLNDEIVVALHISQPTINAIIHEQQQEVMRRETVYRGNRPFPELTGKNIILVDDGIATGATMRAAIQLIQKHNPQRLIIAVPVAEVTTCESMASLVDEMVCLIKASPLYAVGAWYTDFAQTSDAEVIALLQ